MNTGVAERRKHYLVQTRPEFGITDSPDIRADSSLIENGASDRTLGVVDIASTFYGTYGKYPYATLGDSSHDCCFSANPGVRRVYHPVMDALIRKKYSGGVGPVIRRVCEGYRRPGRGAGLSLHVGDLHLLDMIRSSLGGRQTPFIAFDAARLRRNYRLIETMFDDIEIFYSVKTNDHREILSLLSQLGSRFEAASWGEIESLLKLGVGPEDIIYGASVKPTNHIKAAYEAGVRVFAYDSIEEVLKLSDSAPSSDVYLRMSVFDSGDSVFPLAEKFGVLPGEATQMLVAAARSGLHPCGLSFHVGSQCLNPRSWWIAVATCAQVWNEAAREGIELSLLDLGGGIPVAYREPVLDKEIFISHLRLAIRSHFHKKPRLIIEPGRSIVGDAAVMVASVIGKARRKETDWLYIDAGIYQGLLEAAQEIDRFRYLIFAEGGGKKKAYNIGGPTCDSGDVVIRDVVLPEVNCGDRLYILNAGAYTNVCATNFNGFRMPDLYFLDGEGGCMPC